MRRGHEKWAVRRGRVMQIYARDHVEVHPQKKKEVLYLVKKKTKKEQRKKTLKSFFLVWLGILHVKEPGTFFFQFCKVGRVMIF